MSVHTEVQALAHKQERTLKTLHTLYTKDQDALIKCADRYLVLAH